MAQISFAALGTTWQIDTKKELSIELIQEIKARVDLFEKNYSRFRPGSIVSQIAEAAGEYLLPPDAQALFDLYYQLYQITGGKFTPFIGQALVVAGYDKTYSLQPKELHTVPRWGDVAEYQFPYFKTSTQLQLDFGAAGKGLAVDIVTQMLYDHETFEFCIDAGGDIFYSSQHEDLRVGLEHPQNAGEVLGIAIIRNQSICGSAGNRRKWASFHHILDPYLLASPVHVQATWVVASTTMIADALATCLYFVPAEKLAQTFKFEYLIIYSDFSFEKSSHFPAELFIK